MEHTLSMIHDIEELLLHTPEDTDLLRIRDELQHSIQHSATESYATGSLCCIPFNCTWNAQSILLPAQVLSYNSNTARVMILTPITKETVTCPTLLSSSSCDQPDCKYSHGYDISADWLLPIDTLAIDDHRRHYQSDTDVLCKLDHNGGPNAIEQHSQVWQRATLLSSRTQQDIPDIQWQLSNESGETHTVGENQVIPIVYLNGSDGDNVSDTGKENDIDSDAQHMSSNDHGPLLTVNESWGAWQSHTKGFGGKMMEKMGYIKGKGLGKQGQGRLDPIRAYEKGSKYNQDRRPGLGSLEKVKAKAAANGAKTISTSRQDRSSVFDLMNSIFDVVNEDEDEDDTDKQRRSPNLRQGQQRRQEGQKKDDQTKLTKQTNQQKMWELQDKINQLDSDLRKGNEAVKRNKGTSMEHQFQSNVNKIHQQLQSTKRQLLQMQDSASRKKNIEKMTLF